MRPFQDLSLRIKIAIGTTGLEPVTSFVYHISINQHETTALNE
nr:MAG TPA: hypothetical protein [Caudoviricetes sp.]